MVVHDPDAHAARIGGRTSPATIRVDGGPGRLRAGFEGNLIGPLQNGLRRHYTTTFLSEALVIGSYLLTFRLVAVRLGVEGFGEYALSRRALSLLLPVALVGVDMAIARRLARADVEALELERYSWAALLVLLFSLAVLSVVLFVTLGWSASLLFGSARYSDLLLPFPILLLGAGLHGLAYGRLRGTFQIQRANVLMVLNQAIAPPLAVLLLGFSVPLMLLLIGIFWTLTSLWYAVPRRWHGGIPIEAIRDVVDYGARRIPGDLAQLALFALPGIVVAHVSGIAMAGILAFGVAAIGMVGSAVSPIQFVLLPVTTRMLADSEGRELRAHLWSIVRWTFLGLLAWTLVVEVFAKSLIVAYLGPQFAVGLVPLRIVMTGALAWGLTVALRSVIDARHRRALNARILGAGLLTFLLVLGGWYALGDALDPTPVSVAFVLGLYVCGALTTWLTVRITKEATSVPLTQSRASAEDLPEFWLRDEQQ